MKGIDWLAVYAAVLSTIIFARDVLRAKPKVETRLVFGLHPENGHGVYVSVQNKSSHTVHLAAIGPLYRYKSVSFKEKSTYFFKHRRLPGTLGWVHMSFKFHDISDRSPLAIEPGNAHQLFLSEEQIEQILEKSTSRELMFCSQDMLWRNSYSNVLLFPQRKISKAEA